MKIFTIVFFTSFTAAFSYSQDYSNIELVFNDSLPVSTFYRLQDILDTDTIKTNNPDVVIVSFKCSSICSIDWAVEHRSNILGKGAKHYIKICAKRNSKLYFDDIRARTSEGRLIRIGNRVIRLL